MEIQFLGATQVVTGSKYLVKTDKTILIDCGLFQGLKELRLRNWDRFPVHPATIDAVVLTHAHLDHSGYLPLLVKNGFCGKIYGTKYTLEIAKILLLDSGHLQEEEALRANKLGYSKHTPAKPLYTKDDAAAVFKYFKVVEPHQHFNIGNSTICLNYVGHIFGATSVWLKHQDCSIFFSGDVGGTDVPGLDALDPVVAADYLVLESTYGDRLHIENDPEEELASIVNRVVERQGTIIIPAFAVGRAQLLMYYLYQLKQKKKIPDIPIYLDSPMAQNVTDLVLGSDKFFTREIREALVREVNYVGKLEQSKALDYYDFPKVIISASGMATGGRILHHIKQLGMDAKNLILFSGYQAVGTRGKSLCEQRDVKIFGEMIHVNAEIAELHNVSAHLDYIGMLQWLSGIKTAPHKVFIVHGEVSAAKSLKEKIEQRFGWQVMIPTYLEKVTLT